MERNFEFTETESRLAFAALCVECAAKRLGCTAREMYQRMKRIGLIQQIAHQWIRYIHKVVNTSHRTL